MLVLNDAILYCLVKQIMVSLCSMMVSREFGRSVKPSRDTVGYLDFVLMLALTPFVVWTWKLIFMVVNNQ